MFIMLGEYFVVADVIRSAGIFLFALPCHNLAHGSPVVPLYPNKPFEFIMLGSKLPLFPYNSHYFHIIGDDHQPKSVGVYTHYKDS